MDLSPVHGRENALQRSDSAPADDADPVADGAGEPAALLEPGEWDVETETRNIQGEDIEVVRWRNEPRGELLAVSPREDAPELWTASVHDLGSYEHEQLATSEDREQVVAAATEWLAVHPQGTPPGFYGPQIGGVGRDRPR